MTREDIEKAALLCAGAGECSRMREKIKNIGGKEKRSWIKTNLTEQ